MHSLQAEVAPDRRPARRLTVAHAAAVDELLAATFGRLLLPAIPVERRARRRGAGAAADAPHGARRAMTP